MPSSLLVILIAVVVIGVLGIVVIGSIVQPAHDKRALGTWRDSQANPAREDDDLLPEDR